jgi:hypothetical protein
MRTFTVAEVVDYMIELSGDTDPGEVFTDEDGEIVIRTSIYRWSDGSFRDVSESNYCGAV